MGTPRDKSARRFYRVARHRLDDAEALLRLDRTTAAVYLAGYAVECVLEALILARTPAGKSDGVADSFRGTGWHSYDRLRERYKEVDGATLPKAVTEAFVVVRDWATDLRYDPGTLPDDEADAFLGAARVIWSWADGRF